MKRNLILSLLIITLLIISLQFSITKAASDIEDNLNANLEKTQDTVDSTKENIEEIRSSYLQREWRTLLSKSEFGRGILAVSDFFKSLNPLFKAVLGIEYTLSWAFFISVAIWIALIYFLYPISKELLSNGKLGFLFAFIIASLIGTSGVIKKAVEFLGFVVTNIWLAWLSLAIAIVIIFIARYFGFYIKRIIHAEKDKSIKDQLDKDRKIIHSEAEIAKMDLESRANYGRDFGSMNKYKK